MIQTGHGDVMRHRYSCLVLCGQAKPATRAEPVRTSLLHVIEDAADAASLVPAGPVLLMWRRRERRLRLPPLPFLLPPSVATVTATATATATGHGRGAKEAVPGDFRGWLRVVR